MENNGRGGKIKELPRDEKPHMNGFKGNFFSQQLEAITARDFTNSLLHLDRIIKNIPR